MSYLRVAQNIQQLAQDAFAKKSVLKSTPDFEILAVPEGSAMDHYVLLLWGEGKDFPPDRIPEDHLLVPVDVGGRKGYLWHKQAAMSYTV